MKTNFLFLAFSFAAMTLSSCSNEVDDVLAVQDEQIESQDSIFTYDMYFDSEITSYDGTTRSTTANDWKDGDVVYIRFLGANDVLGQAEYISSSNKWRVTSGKKLENTSNSTCRCYFFTCVNSHVDNSNLYFDYLTEAFYSDGKYNYSNNSIYVNATLAPYQWRIRFKGIAGTIISIIFSSNSFSRFNIFNLSSYSYIFNEPSSIFLTVGNNGYTDYFVGTAGINCSEISIKNETTGDSFTRYFDNNTLKEGESGCFTIPTTTDLHGWTLLNAVNGHTFVDLGLPSGTKWASCNIGAASIYESGGYYAWGETEEKNNYDWSNYTHCNGSYGSCYNIGEDIAGTEYDVAYNLWGGTWRMPSIDQFKELEQSCTKVWTKRNGMNGCLITGPNGASIFLPAAGVKSYDQLASFDKSCAYWSSSRDPDLKEYSKLLHISNTNSWTYETYQRFTGIPVRAVCQ